MAKFKLDEIDHQILDILIDNTRVPFTDIAKKLLIESNMAVMANQGLKEDEARAIVEYFRQYDAQN